MQNRPRPAIRSRRGLAALLIAGVSAAGITIAVHRGPALPPAAAATAPAPSAEQPRPVRPVVHTIALQQGGRHEALRVAPRRTQRFSMLGITWTDQRAVLPPGTEVRTRSAGTGEWRPWTGLDTDDDGPGDGGPSRGGSAPLWVGDSDGVEVRLPGSASNQLPEGLRLDLIDPGRTRAAGVRRPATSRPATSGAGPGRIRIAPAAYVITGTTDVTTPGGSATTAATTPSTTAPTTSSTTPSTTPPPTTTSPTPTAPTTPPPPPTPTPPTMVRRAGWQADESLRRSAPQYASAAKVVFVHHTASSNSYSCSDSAAVVRSLYAYHTLSLGWNDIGYNFLVDKCGTLFEGRYGGITRPVIGAHTYGFNTDSAGIAVIGTYTGMAARPAVLATVARLAAWKLSLANLEPTAVSRLVEAASDSRSFVGGRSYAFKAISGHRDGYATECPGDALYAQLPLIRSLAAKDARTSAPVVSVSGTSAPDGRYHTTGRVTVSWSAAASASRVAQYTVLVDGRAAATTTPDSRAVTLTLAPGTHAVAVRTTYLPATATGPTTSTGTATTSATIPTTGPTTATSSTTSPPGTPPSTPSPTTTDSPSVTVVADVTAPRFTSGPVLGLRSGTVNLTGTPVALSWRAADDVYLARVTASAPARATFSPGTTVWNTTAGPGPRTFTLTAADGAGNAKAASVTGQATLLPETAATRTGAWATALNGNHVDRKALFSSARNASLTWTFTGRSVTWIATRTKASGQAVIYLDGAKVATVDLKAARTAFRQGVWTRNGLAPTRHTLKIVVAGTALRPTVITDGIVYLS